MPSLAARIAITVAVHEAIAPRRYHPGLGAVASPPMGGGMSVARRSPFGPVTSHFRPPVSRAVAGRPRAFALAGSAAIAAPSFSIASRTRVSLMERSLTLFGRNGPYRRREAGVGGRIHPPLLHPGPRRVLAEIVIAFPVARRPDRSRREAAGAVGAHVPQDGLDTRRAERALVAADARLGRVRGKRLRAVFAARPELQHHLILPASLPTRPSPSADPSSSAGRRAWAASSPGSARARPACTGRPGSRRRRRRPGSIADGS